MLSMAARLDAVTPPPNATILSRVPLSVSVKPPTGWPSHGLGEAEDCLLLAERLAKETRQDDSRG